MRKKTILPRPPRSRRRDIQEFEEVDLDELTRTSLSTSVEELIENHRADLRRTVEAKEREQQRRVLSLIQRQAREAAAEECRLKVALERGRLLSLQRREKLAREEGAKEAQPVVSRVLATNEQRLRHNSDSARRERLVEQGLLHLQKRKLQKALTAAIAVGTLGILSMVGLAEGAHSKHQLELGQLREKALVVESEAQLRASALEERLEESRDLSEDEKRRLQKALAEVRGTVADAHAEAARLAALTEKAAQKALSRPLKKNPVPQRPAGNTQSSTGVAATETPAVPAATCVDGDPLCWEL